jgi:hypothetical protein
VVDFDRILATLVGFLIKAADKLVALTLWGFAVRFVTCLGAMKPLGQFCPVTKPQSWQNASPRAIILVYCPFWNQRIAK